MRRTKIVATIGPATAAAGCRCGNCWPPAWTWCGSTRRTPTWRRTATVSRLVRETGAGALGRQRRRCWWTCPARRSATGRGGQAMRWNSSPARSSSLSGADDGLGDVPARRHDAARVWPSGRAGSDDVYLADGAIVLRVLASSGQRRAHRSGPRRHAALAQGDAPAARRGARRAVHRARRAGAGDGDCRQGGLRRAVLRPPRRRRRARARHAAEARPCGRRWCRRSRPRRRSTTSSRHRPRRRRGDGRARRPRHPDAGAQRSPLLQKRSSACATWPASR
jgi:hypothetical protein